MSLNFSWKAAAAKLAGARNGGRRAGGRRDPRVVARAVLSGLLLANLAALLFILKPWGGSAADLDRQLGQLRSRAIERQVSLARVRAIVEKVEKARHEKDRFLADYFMERRSASSTVLSEIGRAAREAGLKPKEHAFLFEPVEGSDTLSMMTISANYEGSYTDLVEFVNLVDRSPRFLIIDNIQAAPQREAGVLNARFKLNTFVRDSGRRLAPPANGKAAEAEEGE